MDEGEGAIVSLAKWTANLSCTLLLPLCQYLGVVTYFQLDPYKCVGDLSDWQQHACGQCVSDVMMMSWE